MLQYNAGEITYIYDYSLRKVLKKEGTAPLSKNKFKNIYY